MIVFRFLPLSDMQSAFLFTVIFPPPSARSEIFSRLNSPGTGRTTNADKSFVMQRIIGDIMLTDKLTDFIGGPEQQWIVFDDCIVLIPFQQHMVFSICRMFCP